MHCPKLSDLPAPPSGSSGWPWTEESPRLPDRRKDGSPWPKISIVIPSYNQGHFLEETIRSVLLQGYLNLELFIIDGVSTDNSIDVIKKYAPWLTEWVSEPDRGQSHAINKGFIKCTGDLITFLSSDDLYLKETFADVGTRWDNTRDYGLVVGSFFFIDHYSKLDREIHRPKLPHQGPLDLSITQQWRLHQVSTFYSRSALDSVGRFVREDLLYTMDRELLYRVCKEFKVLLAEHPYAAFRLHAGSKSVSIILPFAREMANMHLLFAPDDASKREKSLRRQLARNCIAHGYLKYARVNERVFNSAAALIAALYFKPKLVVTSDYAKRWIKHVVLKPWMQRNSAT